jgi:integrase/recombinase XerD
VATELIPVLEPDELEALLLVPNPRYLSGRRNRAMLLLMARLGLRVSEVVGHEKRIGGGLRITDIDLTTGKVMIRDAKSSSRRRSKKSGAGRVVYAANSTLDALRRYWEDRSKIISPTDHFFVTSKGSSIAPAFVRQMMRRYGERIGLPEHKRHPHALRHTCGTELYRQTKDIRLVQTVLGHSSPQVTQIYTHLSGADVEDALKQFQS